MIFHRYWYLGPLKTKAAHFFSTLKVNAISNADICPVLFCCLCDVCIWIFQKFLAADVYDMLQYYTGEPLLIYKCRKLSCLAHSSSTNSFPPLPNHIHFSLMFHFPLSVPLLTLARQTLNKMTNLSSVICTGVILVSGNDWRFASENM